MRIDKTLIFPAGFKRQLYVDRRQAHINTLHAAGSNHKSGPALIVRHDGGDNGVTITRCDEVAGNGAFRFVSRESNNGEPLMPEGPAMWLETDSALILHIAVRS
jgi:hypothetical protein